MKLCASVIKGNESEKHLLLNASHNIYVMTTRLVSALNLSELGLYLNLTCYRGVNRLCHYRVHIMKSQH